MNDAANDAAQGAAEDDAAARLKKDLAAVKSDIAHLSQRIADAVNALAAVAQNQGRRGLRQARANVDQAVSGASDRAGAVAGAAQDTASSVAELAGGPHRGPAGRGGRARARRRLSHGRGLAPLTAPNVREDLRPIEARGEERSCAVCACRRRPGRGGDRAWVPMCGRFHLCAATGPDLRLSYRLRRFPFRGVVLRRGLRGLLGQASQNQARASRGGSRLIAIHRPSALGPWASPRPGRRPEAPPADHGARRRGVRASFRLSASARRGPRPQSAF